MLNPWYDTSIYQQNGRMIKMKTQTMASAAAAAKSLQSCLTLCDPVDCSLPGFSIPGILQARTLEWVAISFSNAWKWKVKVKSRSHVRLLVTPWTAAYQASPSMGFSRQEYWSGLPLPSPTYCSIHNAECQDGWSTSWNKECQEKYQSPQICRWHHSSGRKWRTKEPVDES